MRKLPPRGSNHCEHSEKACAESSNPQGDSKGKQDLQSAFSCKAQAIPIDSWCEISAGNSSGTGFPCSAFAGGPWVGHRTHPFGTGMLLQAVLPLHGCPGTAYTGWATTCRTFPLFPSITHMLRIPNLHGLSTRTKSKLIFQLYHLLCMNQG